MMENPTILSVYKLFNLPNRKIIDYASGFQGSRHDFHCYSFTKLAPHPKTYPWPGKMVLGEMQDMPLQNL